MRKKTILAYSMVFLLFFSCEINPAENDATLTEVTTKNVTNITGTTAQCGGIVDSDGGATITACGVCWSTGQTPTISDNRTSDETGTSSFSSDLTGLTPGTTYYVRAYATNSVGTGYGNAISFTTLNLPVLITAEVSDITSTSAKCGGTVTSDGGSAVTSRGVCWSTNQYPTVSDSKTTDGTGTGSFESEITGLTGGNDYYVCAYATNGIGTGYGSVKSFRTDNIPSVSTAEVSEITATTAKCGGTVTSDGGSAVTSRGVCWSTSQYPTASDSKTTDGTGTGSFESEITGLTAGTNYYVRAYATNSVGTGYGSERSFFILPETGTVTDIDGNTYQTVKIGDQWWMTENLKVTHYRDGTAIPHVIYDTDWYWLSVGAYCIYDYGSYWAPNNDITYGRLYNWYAVNGSRYIAPTGWHVPSNTDWQSLIDYLGVYNSAGGKLKEAGISHWNSPNTGATNESGFSVLPGGYRDIYGNYNDMGYHAYFWSSTESSSSSAYIRSLDYNNSGIFNPSGDKNCGFSIRCIKD